MYGFYPPPYSKSRDRRHVATAATEATGAVSTRRVTRAGSFQLATFHSNCQKEATEV